MTTEAEAAQDAYTAGRIAYWKEELAYYQDWHDRLIADHDYPRRAYWLAKVNKELRKARAKLQDLNGQWLPDKAPNLVHTSTTRQTRVTLRRADFPYTVFPMDLSAEALKVATARWKKRGLHPCGITAVKYQRETPTGWRYLVTSLETGIS